MTVLFVVVGTIFEITFPFFHFFKVPDYRKLNLETSVKIEKTFSQKYFL